MATQAATTPGRSIARVILRGLGLISLLLLLVLLWLLLTPSGLRTLLRFTPDAIRFDSASGSALGEVQLKGLRFNQDGLQVSVQELNTRIRYASLWQRVLHIPAINARNVRITQASSAAAPNNQDTTALAWQLRIDTIRVESLQMFSRDGATADVDISLLDGQNIRLANQNLQIGSLRVDERRVQLHGAGVLALDATSKTKSNLKLSAKAMPELLQAMNWPQPFTLELAVSGDPSTLQIKANASAPTALTLDATLRNAASDLRWEGKLSTAAINTAIFSDALPFAQLALDVRGSGSMDSIALQGDVQLDEHAFKIDSLALLRDRKANALQLQSLKLQLPNGGTLNAQALWPLAMRTSALTSLTTHSEAIDSPNADIRLSWTNFALPASLAWPQSLQSASGNAALTGAPEQFDLKAELQLTRKLEIQSMAGQVALALNVTPSQITVSELTIKPDAQDASASSGSAQIQGTLTRTPTGGIAALDLKLLADQLNPALILSDYPGAMGAAASLQLSQLDSTTPSGELRIDSLSGTLKSRPLAGAGALRFNQSWRPEGTLNVAWGNNSVTLRPQANADLQTSLDLQEFGLFAADARGSVQGDLLWLADAQGRLVGVDGALSARLLSIAQFKISELELKVQAPDGANAPIALNLSAADVQLGDAQQRVQELALSLNGTRAQHALEASLSAPSGAMSLRANGALSLAADQPRAWTGLLQSLRIKPQAHAQKTALPELVLQAPSQLRIGDDGLSVEQACFRREFLRASERTGQRTWKCCDCAEHTAACKLIS
jgi:hypothetical protein